MLGGSTLESVIWEGLCKRNMKDEKEPEMDRTVKVKAQKTRINLAYMRSRSTQISIPAEGALDRASFG